MSKSDRQFYLIFLMVVSVAVGLWFMSNSHLFFRTPYVVIAPDAGGLSNGSEVWINGPIHGEVIKVVETTDKRAAIYVEIERGIEITSTAALAVRSKGMVGQRVLDIQLRPGGKPMAKGDTLYSIYEAGPVHLVVYAQQFFQGSIEALSLVNEAFENTLADSTNKKNLTELGAQLGKLGGRIQRLTKYYAKEIPEHFNEGIEALSRIGQESQKISEPLGDVVTELKSLKSDIIDWTNNFEQAMKPIGLAHDKILAGEGTLGKITSDPEFLTQWKRLKSNVDSIAVVFNKGEIVINADIF